MIDLSAELTSDEARVLAYVAGCARSGTRPVLSHMDMEIPRVVRALEGLQRIGFRFGVLH